MKLDQLGWRHVVSNATKKHCPPPFKPGDASTKVWYSKPCATALSRHYLLALLHGSWEVKHCRSSSYYAALLNGGHLPEQRAGRAGKMKFVAQNEEDLEAGASPPKPPKAKREARPAKKLDDACSDSEAFEAPGSPSACSSSSSNSSSRARIAIPHLMPRSRGLKCQSVKNWTGAMLGSLHSPLCLTTEYT